MSVQPVLINGEWTASAGTQTFRAANPRTREALPDEYPVSPWDEVDRAIQAAAAAFAEVRGWPGARFANFLENYASLIEQRADELVELASRETGLPISPRLKDVELPRTYNQLRQAAAAAREGSWTQPTIDTKTNIRSMYGPIGPVVMFGPNNFPFAFNGIAGGDFAAAVAAGNPVIAKGHPLHPATTRLFGELVVSAMRSSEMPRAFVQLIYRTAPDSGLKLVSHPQIAATGYTGSRHAALKLKEAADRAGKLIYLEMSSVNPVFVLPGALEERLEKVADELAGSCVMGAGQFCTSPGIAVVQEGPAGERFIAALAERMQKLPVGTMLGEGGQRGLAEAVEALRGSGAQLVTGGAAGGGEGYCYRNTILRVDGDMFLAKPSELQQEAFGNVCLVVTARDALQMQQIAGVLEGNLTGCIYSHTGGQDDRAYDVLAPVLRKRVGRLLNDKMPTGVAVSPAMNHGGPYPATGHPGFTAVGIPASIRRFAMLECYDAVRPHRLPPLLQDKIPGGLAWRSIDGEWTRGDVQAPA